MTSITSSWADAADEEEAQNKKTTPTNETTPKLNVKFGVCGFGCRV